MSNKKPSGYYFVINGDPYMKDILCFVGANEPTVKTALDEYVFSREEKREFLRIYDHGAALKSGLTIRLNTGKQAVFFNKGIRPNTSGIQIVCHEMFHATYMIMCRSGMGNLTNDNEEAYAYLLDNLVGQFWQKLKK